MPKTDLPLVGLCKKCKHLDLGLVKDGEFQCSKCIAAAMGDFFNPEPSTIRWSTTISTNSTNTDTSSTTDNWRP